MKLNSVTDNPRAKKARTRVGRGGGSGVGKTCGRGYKGQKSRSGVSIKGSEGGQTPIHMRMPKRGFKPLNRRVFQEISIKRLEFLVVSGKLSKDEVVGSDVLKAKGLIKSAKRPLKLLGGGSLSTPLKLDIHFSSQAAKEVVKKSGGTFVQKG